MTLSLGGAVLGAGISQIIGTLIGFDFMASLGRALEPGFSSLEKKVQYYRNTFHHYHLTEMDGQCVWRYSCIDFQKYYDVGKLGGIVEYIGKGNAPTYYKVEGGFRDERLILFLKAVKRGEPTIIEIFPTFGKEIQDKHCGVVVVETWDETHIVSRCIMSRSPILNWTSAGTLPSELGVQLDQMWVNGLHHDFSPIANGCVYEGSVTIQT